MAVPINIKTKANKRFSGKNVVITGGSSGIGLATAKIFYQLDANVFIIARDEERLKNACLQIEKPGQKNTIIAVRADVGEKEQVDQAIEQIAAQGGVHTLINNVGTTLWHTFEKSDVTDLERVMRVNYFGMVYTIQKAWPYLAEAEDSHIGLVSSVGGYLGAYGYSSYSPTKFAVTGLAECLRMEAADAKIGVTVIFPPDTDTPMLEAERLYAPAECHALSKESGIMTARKVAELFVKAIVDYRFEVVCNFESKFLRLWRTFFPRSYFKFIDNIIISDRRRRGLKPNDFYCR